MYLQETYITDEEALDIVLEYLWNEYEYETEEELYEAYEYLTDEEFEDILNEGLLRNVRNVGGALFDAGKAAFNTARKSYRERSATSKFDDAVKKKKVRRVEKAGKRTTGRNRSLQQAPNIADRVVPSASGKNATSSVVPVKFGKQVRTYNKPGGRTMNTSTVVPVNGYAAKQSAAGEVAKIKNEQERVKREKETKRELKRRKNAAKRDAEKEELNNAIKSKRSKRRRRKKNSALNNLPTSKKAQTPKTNQLNPLDKRNIISKAPTVETSKPKSTVAGRLRRDDFNDTPTAGPTAGAVLARALDGGSPIGTSNKRTKSGRRKKVSGPAKREQVKQALRSFDNRMYDRRERNRKARENR